MRQTTLLHQQICRTVASDSSSFTNALWISYYLGMKCVIIHMSHSMTRAGKYSGVIIHRIINSTNDKILLGKLSTISEQILTSNPVFNCGLFTFDWSLMYTMVVSTTAYLAFLIQFDIPLL
ncbi:gustatory receptor for bitter taste 66a-like [Lutzomyia longipalpis]|uniref:gustatory receptor for bitter taste 66a-like n=1 Tax=Lutzomyia longipalpis TaxID=7200 RepID=UPI0024833C40|nr:gustatory receptor for bitter taste 66a-like [Lutzomyia longipalpis]